MPLSLFLLTMGNQARHCAHLPRKCSITHRWVWVCPRATGLWHLAMLPPPRRTSGAPHWAVSWRPQPVLGGQAGVGALVNTMHLWGAGESPHLLQGLPCTSDT